MAEPPSIAQPDGHVQDVHASPSARSEVDAPLRRLPETSARDRDSPPLLTLPADAGISVIGMPDFEALPEDQALTHVLSPEDKAFILDFVDEVRPSTDPDISNRTTGMVLILLNEVLGIPLARAWRMVRPTSASTGHNAETQASRRIKWFRQRYPLNFREAAEVNGITPEYVWSCIRQLMSAKKWRWNPKAEKYEITDEPDTSAINMGISQYRAMVEIDKATRREAVMGKSEEKTRLNTAAEVWRYSGVGRLGARRRKRMCSPSAPKRPRKCASLPKGQDCNAKAANLKTDKVADSTLV